VLLRRADEHGAYVYNNAWELTPDEEDPSGDALFDRFLDV
jgi:hypothetical protein